MSTSLDVTSTAKTSGKGDPMIWFLTVAAGALLCGFILGLACTVLRWALKRHRPQPIVVGQVWAFGTMRFTVGEVDTHFDFFHPVKLTNSRLQRMWVSRRWLRRNGVLVEPKDVSS